MIPSPRKYRQASTEAFAEDKHLILADSDLAPVKTPEKYMQKPFIPFALSELAAGVVFYHVPTHSSRVHRATVKRLIEIGKYSAIAYVSDETLNPDGSAFDAPRECAVGAYSNNAFKTEQDAIASMVEDLEHATKLLYRRMGELEEKAREDRWEAATPEERENGSWEVAR